jgi:uncharacterized protein YggE
LTQVRLGVEIQGKTAQAVQQQVAQRSQAVIELLKSRKVEKLETTGISLNPNYSYKDGKQASLAIPARTPSAFGLIPITLGQC